MILLFSGHLTEVTPMTEEYGEFYPMTHLESLLKQCFLQRPELSKRSCSRPSCQTISTG